MPDGAIEEEKRVASGKSISAIFSPVKRARNYTLGVVWWSYPIHLCVWLVFIAYILGAAFLDVNSGMQSISMADIAMWAVVAYVLGFMIRTAYRDKRLSGASKVNFYFAFGSACIIRAATPYFVIVVMAVAMSFLPGHEESAKVSANDEGYLIDDIWFMLSAIFWGMLYMAYSRKGYDDA